MLGNALTTHNAVTLTTGQMRVAPEAFLRLVNLLNQCDAASILQPFEVEVPELLGHFAALATRPSGTAQSGANRPKMR